MNDLSCQVESSWIGSLFEINPKIENMIHESESIVHAHQSIVSYLSKKLYISHPELIIYESKDKLIVKAQDLFTQIGISDILNYHKNELFYSISHSDICVHIDEFLKCGSHSDVYKFTFDADPDDDVIVVESLSMSECLTMDWTPVADIFKPFNYKKITFSPILKCKNFKINKKNRRY